MRHSTNPPKKEEAMRIELMMRMGCILTRLRTGVYAPAECHHLVDGNIRMGHEFTIPLTPYFHRGVLDAACSKRDMVKAYGASLADGSKAFEKSHGYTELDLWRIVQKRLGLDADLPESKILPRRAS